MACNTSIVTIAAWASPITILLHTKKFSLLKLLTFRRDKNIKHIYHILIFNFCPPLLILGQGHVVYLNCKTLVWPRSTFGKANQISPKANALRNWCLPTGKRVCASRTAQSKAQACESMA